MSALLDAVSTLAARLPPERVRKLAACLRSPTNGRGAVDCVNTEPSRALVAAVLDAWGRTSLPGDVVAGMLEGAAHAQARARAEQRVELVWTGPTTRYAATRRTDQVLLDLVDGAERELFLTSFVVYDVPRVAQALNAAIARGVEVRFLVESSVAHGGSLEADPAAQVRDAVPGAERYAWVVKSGPHAGGKVHAKTAVADGRVALVTSANLTGHALEKNMEAGVLIRGGALPDTLRAHLRALIDTGVVVRT